MNSKLTLSELLDSILADQNEKCRDPNAPRAEDYFLANPELETSAEHAIDVIYNEFRLKFQYSRSSANTKDYLDRFPRFAAELEKQFLLFFSLNQSESPATSSPDPLELGDAESRFTLGEKLGQGGFANVYRAWDGQLKRNVAIKIARLELDSDSNQFSRFVREAESAASLSHPNIVGIHEFGNEDGRPFIVCQMLEGGDLRSRIRDADYSHVQAAKWMETICEAVNYAHQMGIVHRDIKPANILFNASDEPSLTDFGLAGLLESDQALTQQGDFLGTPAYMSPEQAGGETQVGPASDIYSLGVVLYELICRNLPFEGRSSSILQQTISKDPPPPRTHDPAVPLDLQTIALKAMAKDRKDRYSTAREFAEDLRRFVNHEPINARPLSPFGRFSRFCRRQPALAFTIVTAIVLISAITIMAFQSITQQRNLFRSERDRANQQLYHSLLMNAENSLQSKQTGWYEQSLASLREAAQMDLQGLDLTRHRELMIEALVDTTFRFNVKASNASKRSTVQLLAIAPTSEWIACYRLDGSLQILDANTLLEVSNLSTPESPLVRIEFSTDQQTLFALSGGAIWRWNLGQSPNGATQALPKKLGFESVESFAVSNINTIAIAREGMPIQVFLIQSGAIGPEVMKIESGKATLNDLVFSPNSEVVFGALNNGAIVGWSVIAGAEVARREYFNPTIKIAANGTAVMSTDLVSNRIDLWTPIGDELYNTPTQKTRVTHVGTTASRKIAATQTGDLLWVESESPPVAKVKVRAGGFGQITALGTCQNSELIIVGYQDGTLRSWDFKTSEFVTVKSQFGSAMFKDQQETFWSGKTRFKIDKNQNQTILQNHSFEKIYDACVCARSGDTYFARGNDLVVYSAEGDLTSFDTVFDTPIERIAVSPDGGFVALYSRNRLVVQKVTDQSVIQDLNLGGPRLLAIAISNAHLVYATNKGTFITSISSKVGDDVPQQLCAGPLVDSGISCSDRYIAFARNDHSIEVRRAGDLTLVRNLIGHQKTINQIEIANEQLVSLSSEDETIRFWNLGTGDHRKVSVSPTTNGFCLDPRHEMLVLIEQKYVRLASLETGKPVASYFNWFLSRAIQFDASGGHLWVDNRRFARPELDASLRSGGNLKNFRVEFPAATMGYQWTVSVSPNGSWHVEGGYDRHVYVRDARSLEPIVVFGGSQLGIEDDIWCSDFSPNSERMAIGSRNSNGVGEISFWNTSDWECDLRVPFGAKLVADIEFHPEFPLIAASSFDGTIGLIDSRTGELIRELSGTSSAAMDICFSDDGKFLATARTSSGVTIWPISSSETNWVGEPIQVDIPGELIWGVTFSSDQQMLAMVSEAGNVMLYDFPSCQSLVVMRSGANQLRKVEFSGDNQHLIVSRYPENGQIWDLKKLRKQLREWNLDW